MRLIDADALMEKLMGKCRDGEVLYSIPPSAIDNAPTITPESLVRHGKWIQDGFFYACSECGAIWHEEWIKSKALKYCNECGAKMDLENKSC